MKVTGQDDPILDIFNSADGIVSNTSTFKDDHLQNTTYLSPKNLGNFSSPNMENGQANMEVQALFKKVEAPNKRLKQREFTPLVITKINELVSPRERIRARFERETSEREFLRQQIGNPVEAFSKFLADVPSEIIERNYELDENGLIHVKRLQD